MANFIFNILLKKTSTFALCGIVSAFVIEGSTGVVTEAIYNSLNRGLLWDHIKDKYKKAGDES